MPDIDFRTDLLPLKNKLFRLALRITMDTMEAEDVVEDTLIRVWQKRAELQYVRSLEAYCLTVCRNLALDRHDKREAQNLSLAETEIDAADTAPTPHDKLVATDRLTQVRRIFETLPERQRTVVQLRDIEGLSMREIAEIVGATEDVVKVTLHRARKTMRSQLELLENYGL